jgi:hypothetical protein
VADAHAGCRETDEEELEQRAVVAFCLRLLLLFLRSPFRDPRFALVMAGAVVVSSATLAPGGAGVEHDEAAAGETTVVRSPSHSSEWLAPIDSIVLIPPQVMATLSSVAQSVSFAQLVEWLVCRAIVAQLAAVGKLCAGVPKTASTMSEQTQKPRVMQPSGSQQSLSVTKAVSMSGTSNPQLSSLSVVGHFGCATARVPFIVGLQS